MPNANRSQTFYSPTGNPETMNSASLYFPGQLGQAFDANDRTYQTVQLDSGATSATATGVVAANQLAFWKDRATYLVTNVAAAALFGGVANSYRNNVAGVFAMAVTAGYYCNVIQRGRAVNLKEAGSATAGMSLCANASSTAADALGTAIATASPTQNLGVVITATSGVTCVADLDIPNIP